MSTSGFMALARLDFAEVVRSRWLLVCVALYAALAGLFVLVGLRESSVMGFTGMGRMLFSFSHALLLLLPLVALAVSAQVVNRAREDGTLELLLTQPVRRATFLAAATATRVVALVVPLAAMFVLIAVLGGLFGQAVPWRFLARAIALCSVLLWAFTALGIALSVHIRNGARALTAVVVAWALAVALLDFGLIGLMLSWRLEPVAVFALAVLNPVEAVRVALLSAAQPDLATLGPVGFFLVERLGDARILALGIGWPLLFGALVWWGARRSFERGDVA